MLLIVGGESDPNTQRIVDQAHIRAMDYLFWDTDEEGSLRIAWDFESPDLDLGEKRVRPTAIFLRCNVFGGDPRVNRAVHEMMQSYALVWPQIKLLNRHSTTDFNNKSFNLKLAMQLGFTIPETLALSHHSPLKSIPSPEKKIAKPLGGGAYTKDISKLAKDDEALTSLGPQFIQERIDGENLRVFSIGGELSCFHLATSALDYREDDQVDVIQVDLPFEIVEPTERLVEAKKFDYCALDFRCRNGFEQPVFWKSIRFRCL